MKRCAFALALFLGFFWHALFSALHEMACRKLSRRARALTSRAQHHKARAEFHTSKIGAPHGYHP